jgi:hypothetical protein
MQIATLLALPTEEGGVNNAEWRTAFGSVPELPSLGQRWTVRRKATVVEAVRGGWVPIEEVCRIYSLSADELLAWERDIDRHGIHGLRTTRYQIYRDAERR